MVEAREIRPENRLYWQPHKTFLEYTSGAPLDLMEREPFLQCKWVYHTAIRSASSNRRPTVFIVEVATRLDVEEGTEASWRVRHNTLYTTPHPIKPFYEKIRYFGDGEKAFEFGELVVKEWERSWKAMPENVAILCDPCTEVGAPS